MCDDDTPFTTSFHLLSVQTTESLEFKLFHTKLNRSRITFTHKKLSWQLKGSLSSTEESVEVLDGSYWSSLALAPQTPPHKAQTDPTTQQNTDPTTQQSTDPFLANSSLIVSVKMTSTLMDNLHTCYNIFLLGEIFFRWPCLFCSLEKKKCVQLIIDSNNIDCSKNAIIFLKECHSNH